jgi:hypothetical protein
MMSMRENPGGGFVAKVEALISLLPVENQQEAREILADWLNEKWSLCDYLCDFLPEHFPRPVEVFMLGDEDTPDGEMERGIVYAIFEEDDLYERVPSAKLKAMEAKGVRPQFSNWTVWG